MAARGKFRVVRYACDCILAIAGTLALYTFGYPRLALIAFAIFWFFNGAIFGFWGGRRHTIMQLKQNAQRFERDLRS